MSTLISIGNLQGIRIPKPIIKQADLADKELELVVVKEGLLIKPIEQHHRETWAEDIKAVMAEQGGTDEALLDDTLNDSDLEDTVW